MVNGYLLYDKKYTVTYLKKKVFHYCRFLILWCLVIGFLVSIKGRKFIDGIHVFTSVFVGSGWLFHLWFVITLVIIHIGYFAIYTYISHRNIGVDKIVPWWLLVVFIVLMNGIFLLDIFCLMPTRSLVAIIPIPYRFIRYVGYFVLGLYFRKLKYRETKITIPNWALILIAVASYIILCAQLFYVNLSDVWSTNTFYPSVFCTIGVIAIFVLCMNQKANALQPFWKAVQWMTSTSVGIWVLHPLARSVLRKLMEVAGIELTLLLRILMVPVIFMSCMIVSKVALKVKGVQILFRI